MDHLNDNLGGCKEGGLSLEHAVQMDTKGRLSLGQLKVCCVHQQSTRAGCVLLRRQVFESVHHILLLVVASSAGVPCHQRTSDRYSSRVSSAAPSYLQRASSDDGVPASISRLVVSQ